MGILKIPMEADLKLFDGQHRALGIMDFCQGLREYRRHHQPVVDGWPAA
ncbi:hypothetical protein ACVCEQ_27275 (plasmid) [Klebsiella pneumoniae]